MQLFVSKAIKLFQLDWRISLLLISFIFVLFVAMPILPTELRMVALLIPFSVFTTAAFTYWMVAPSTNSKVALKHATLKAPKLTALSKVSPISAQELFDNLPIALLRLAEDGTIKQTNQFSRNILGIKEGATPNLSEIVSGLSRPVPDWLDELSQRAAGGKPKLVQVTGPKSEVFLDVSLISMNPRGSA